MPREFLCPSKADIDHRASQLNPNNEAYWKARGLTKPPPPDKRHSSKASTKKIQVQKTTARHILMTISEGLAGAEVGIRLRKTGHKVVRLGLRVAAIYRRFTHSLF